MKPVDHSAVYRSFTENLQGDIYDFTRNNPDLSYFNVFASARLIERADKRFRLDNDDSLEANAFGEFLRVNATVVKSVTLPEDVISNASDFIRHALELYTKRIDPSSVQSCVNMTGLLTSWRFGPGATIGTTQTHFSKKIRSGKIRCTSKAYPLVRLARLLNPHVRVFDDQHDTAVEFVEASKMSTVPKNASTRRTICTEPLWNMSLQLAAGTYIEGALREVKNDITIQADLNKELARIGSITSALCTIDLSNASDMISPALIRILWPREWYQIFDMLRSPCTLVQGARVELNMLSTMGNGFTFPMMTLTLLSLCYALACRKEKGRRYYLDKGRIGVFGDDIIIPSDWYDDMCQILSECGLVVNNSKSYSKGLFRESCGGDYYCGVDVTPFYVKDITTQNGVYVAINQLRKWSGFHRIPLPKTYDYLIGLLKGKPLYVPYYEPDYSGIRSKHCPRRYYNLQVDVRRSNLRFAHPLDILSVLGNYCTSSARGFLITKRAEPVYIIKKSRLPKGYLDGSTLCEQSFEDQDYTCYLYGDSLPKGA